MKKQILTLLSATLLLSACSLNPTAQPDNSDTTSQNQTPSQSESTARSLKDLMGLGSAQKCTWSYTDEQGNSTSGEMLIDGQKFSQTVNSKTSEESMVFRSVSDGELVYTWNDQVPDTGFKMSLAETQSPDSPDVEDDQSSPDTDTPKLDFEQKYNYNCTPVTVSDSDFLPPSGINFIDLSQETPNYQEMLKQFAPTE